MIVSHLDKRASLTVCPPEPAPGALQSREFATLREALGAATAALGVPGAKPWILTEDGDLLSPNWIRARAAAPH